MSFLLKYRKGFPKLFISGLLLILSAAAVGALGPVFFDEDESVSIYRDFDDGLFGRSLYRGVIFSVKLQSFDRYRSLPVKEIDGLTGYLLSDRTARNLAKNEHSGIHKNHIDGVVVEKEEDPGLWIYHFAREGIEIDFSLERAPDDLLSEIDRTYPNNASVAEQVKESYGKGWVIRIHLAENVYRPGVTGIDYEDVMICASLLGEKFQPLWGLHDGNALLSVD